MLLVYHSDIGMTSHLFRSVASEVRLLYICHHCFSSKVPIKKYTLSLSIESNSFQHKTVYNKRERCTYYHLQPSTNSLYKVDSCQSKLLNFLDVLLCTQCQSVTELGLRTQLFSYFKFNCSKSHVTSSTICIQHLKNLC